MDYRERIGDREEGIRAALDGQQAGIWTSLPGIIESFDPIAVTATVQPTIQGVLSLPDGTTKYLNLPVIPDVPVRFPGGGGMILTWPLEKGDECQLHFQARNMDSWWQQGDVQRPLDTRMHDLSDAICSPGSMSQPKAAALVGGVNMTGAQWRSLDGTLSITSAGTAWFVLGDLHVSGEVVRGFGGADQVTLGQHEHPTAAPGGPSRPTPGT